MELLARRSREAPASAWYPQPGQGTDTILLAHSDGLPAVFRVRGIAVHRSRRVVRHVQRFPGVAGSLIVTDGRTALASSAGGEARSMLVGQIRHTALVALRRRRHTVVLHFDQPGEGRCVARVDFADVRVACAAMREIAARAGCPATR